MNSVKSRRSELRLTQQEAARRADVSLATWRRFEGAVVGDGALDGFRPENLQGFARALQLSVVALRRLVSSDDATPGQGGEVEAANRGAAGVVGMFNKCFIGEPLTPADAMVLSHTVTFSDFAPVKSGQFHVDDTFGYQFAAFLKGEATIREVDLLCDLPELALTQVNNHWLVRMGERIMRIGAELDAGRVPRPECLADEYALWIVIANTEPPQDSDILEMYPGLRMPEDVFGHDPDFDDPDDPAGREEWMNRMVAGLLPPEESNDFRRYDLDIMEAYGQGIYDPADPRHPLRWFDRDDLRERCESALEFVRLPAEEQARRSAEMRERAVLLAPRNDMRPSVDRGGAR
ncbi:Helix-turn-helix domain-containing protein [Amycolatopsis lurida]|uniref:HTH cro/C1-type domain-containing protein n=1 Tax=Amycolatopsis lurida NRRL 2430 TaxID=1460371 RepID=A0A2P2FP05_AMYLU|nr:helix-turn-helix transcriptional regulator [Amycolatopsis lurida]KFU78452.1 hypothetical protein BB31_25090 [Amycolatopsis lurida NRRL 2430]SEE26574.1 Helix-turn-helix domain-containing protein [Amycolatopsis lurida]